MTSGYAFILMGVFLNAAAQLLLKAGTNTVGPFELVPTNIAPIASRLVFEPHIVAGVLCYAVSLVVWIIGLSRVEVSVAYPMLSLGYIANAVAAWYFFDESVGPLRLAGIALIVTGVALISRS
jgi:multidrug transporter EmrE-like cation transporter